MVAGGQYVLLAMVVMFVTAAIFFDRWHKRQHQIKVEERLSESAGYRLAYLLDIFRVYFATTKNDVETKAFFEWLKSVSGDRFDDALAQLKKSPSATPPVLRIVTSPKPGGVDMQT